MRLRGLRDTVGAFLNKGQAAEDILEGKQPGKAFYLWIIVRHCREQRLLSRSALVYHKVAEYSAEFVHHAGDVLAALVELAQELNTPGNVPCSGHFCELIQMMIVGDPCAAPYGVLGDVAADCDTAVEQGKRVAHSSVGEPGYHVRSLLSKGDSLLLSYAEQPLRNCPQSQFCGTRTAGSGKVSSREPCEAPWSQE